MKTCHIANKKKYPTKKQALGSASIAKKNHNKILRPYKCKFCNYYHLTSQPKEDNMAIDIELHTGSEPVKLVYNENCYCLQFKQNRYATNKETGEKEKIDEEWISKLFFASPVAAFNKLLTIKVGNSNAKTIKELIEAIEAAKSELTDVYDMNIKGKTK